MFQRFLRTVIVKPQARLQPRLLKNAQRFLRSTARAMGPNSFQFGCNIPCPLRHGKRTFKLKKIFNDSTEFINPQTCKPMYETFQSSSQLLYIIQLHLDGLKDAGTAMPYSERVQRLLRQREAWSSLMSSKKLRYSPLDVEPGYHQVWQLVGGAFANRAKQHSPVSASLMHEPYGYYCTITTNCSRFLEKIRPGWPINFLLN
jgi:hypothetical protein